MTEKDHRPEELIREGFMFTQYEIICPIYVHASCES